MISTGDLLSGSAPLLAGAAALGLVGGYAFQRIRRGLLPSAWTRAFREKLPGDVRGMLKSEEPSEMMRHYRAVLAGMGLYAVRNAFALLVALLPIGALFVTLAAWDPSGRIAERVEAHPAPAAFEAVGRSQRWSLRGDRMLADRAGLRAAGLSIGGYALDGAMLADKHAFCASMTSCLLFEMMLFETHASESAGIEGPIVVRPAHLDGNPFWPYLNDLELWFFAAALLGSGGAAWLHRARDGARP